MRTCARLARRLPRALAAAAAAFGTATSSLALAGLTVCLDLQETPCLGRAFLRENAPLNAPCPEPAPAGCADRRVRAGLARNAAAAARLRGDYGIYGPGDVLVKRIAAFPGDAALFVREGALIFAALPGARPLPPELFFPAGFRPAGLLPAPGFRVPPRGDRLLVLGPGRYFVAGDHPLSIDSRVFGPLDGARAELFRIGARIL